MPQLPKLARHDWTSEQLGAKAATVHTHTLDQTTDTATRLALTPDERTKLTNTSGTNTGDQDLSGYLTSSTAATTYAPISGQFATHTLTPAASVTLSADSPAQSLAMTTDTTLVAPTVTDGHAIVLWLTGAYVPTWFTIKWAGGTAPTYAGAGTLYHFVTLDGGTTWLGSGQAYS